MSRGRFEPVSKAPEIRSRLQASEDVSENEPEPESTDDKARDFEQAMAARLTIRPLFVMVPRGEMSEWPKEPDSKSGVPVGYRGFESRSLRCAAPW